MHITPDILESAYEFLRRTPPFKGWHLPPSDEVEFHAVPLKDHCADYSVVDGTHVIRVCILRHAHLYAVVISVAHEMCHLRQQIAAPHDKAHHGAYWKRLAKQVCRIQGFDPKTF
jgi:hypothetical protein